MSSTKLATTIARTIGATLLVLLASTSRGQQLEPVILRGHFSNVLMGQFTAQGERALTASADETLRLWDARTGREQRQYVGHTGPVYCLAVSGDGRTLVSGAQDNTVRLWDIPLLKPVLRVNGHDMSGTGLSLSPDGRFLVSTGIDKAVRVWDTVRLGSQAAAMMPMAPVLDRTTASNRVGHAAEIRAVTYRANGTMFATADSVGGIQLWSPYFDTSLGTLGQHTGGITALAFHSNNQQLLSAGDDGTVRVWQLPPIPTREFAAGTSVRDMAMIPNQLQAVIATEDKSIRLLDANTLQATREFPKPEHAVTTLSVAPNGSLLAVGDESGRARFLNFGDGADRGVVAGHAGPIRDLSFHADNQRLISAGQDGTVRFWQLPVASIPVNGHAMPVRCIASASSGQWSVSGSDDKTVRVWNAAGQPLRAMANHQQGVTSVAIKRDDQQLASGDADGVVWLWNGADGAPQGTLFAHSGAITAMDYDRTQPWIWTGGVDGLIKRWQLPLTPPRVSPGHSQPIRTVAVSSDGKWAVTGSQDQTVRVWDLSNGQAVRALAESNLLGPVTSVAISPNNGLIAAAGESGVVMVWNLADGALRMKRNSSAGIVHDLAWLPDNKRFITLSQDQLMRSWEVADPAKETVNDGAPYLAAAISGDGKRFAIAGTSGGKPAAIVRDRESGQVLATVVGHDAPLTALSLNKTGNRLITGAADKTARIWNLDGGVTELRKQEGHPAAVIAVAISDDGAIAFSSAGENNIRQWNVADGMEIRQLAGHTAVVRQLVMRGPIIYSAADDGTIRFWDSTNGTATRTLTHGGNLRLISLNSENTRLSSAGTDRIVKIWNVADGTNTVALPALASDVTAIAFSLDSQQVAVAAADGIRTFSIDGKLLEKIEETATTTQGLVWQARSILAFRADGRTIAHQISADQAIAIPDAETNVLAISFDGKSAMTSGAAKVIRIWPMADGRFASAPGQPVTPLRTLNAAQARITDITFSPDGGLVAASSEDKDVTIWEMNGIAGAGGDVAPKWKFTQSSAARSVALGTTEPRLAVCGDDGFVSLWDLRLGKLAERMTQNQPQKCIAFGANRAVISGGQDSALRTWTPAISAMFAATVEPVADPIVKLFTTVGDTGLVAITQRANGIQRWKVDGSPLPPIASPAGPIKQAAVSADGTKVTGMTAEGVATQWTLSDGAARGPINLGLNVTSIVYGRGANELFIADNQPRVRAFSLETSRVTEEIPFTLPITQAIVTGPEARQLLAIGAQPQGLMATRSLLRLWDGGADAFTAVAISIDGARFFAANAKGKISQWRLNDGQLEQSFEGHTDQVHELALSANGQLLASCSRDKTVRIWNLADGKELRSIPHHCLPLTLSVSADSQRIAISGDDGRVDVLELATGLPLQSLVGHMPGGVTVCWHADNQTLVTSAADKTVRVWRTSIVRTIPAATNDPSKAVAQTMGCGIVEMAMVNGGAQVATITRDGRALMLDFGNGQIVRQFAEGLADPRCIAVRPDSQRIAVATADGQVRVWNSGNGELLQTLTVSQPASALAWSLDGTKLAIGTSVTAGANPAQALLVIYGPPVPPQTPQPGNELVRHLETSFDQPFVRLSFDREGRSVWSCHPNGQVNSWAYASPTFVRRFDHGGPVYAVVVSRDGNTVVSGSVDQTVRIWDAKTGQQRAQLNGHTAPIHALAMTPDESMVVSTSADRTVRLWDISGGRQLKQLATFDETMYAVAVHPNGQTVAVGGADRGIHLLNILSGAVERELTGHTDYVQSLAFNSQGTRLLSYGYAGNLKVWNLADGKLLFGERVGRVGNTAYYGENDGRVLLANGDGTARVMELPAAAR